jgi:hypothetical protein
MSVVKPITGRGITTKVGMEAADLGIPRWDAQRGANAVMFGDNFTNWGMTGEWQSPSIVMYDNDYTVLGIPTVGGIASEGNRRQLWDYPHNNPEYSTILPCDFIKVGAWWYVACMVTAGLGNELRTVFWRSTNLVEWVKTEPYVALHHRGDHPGNTMLTFDRIGDYIYTFGTNGLRRDSGIWMWRSEAAGFPANWFEPWGWDGTRWGWGVPNEKTPILGGRYGELCFRYIQGNSVLSFFDEGEYRQTALTVVNPTDDWHHANRCDYAHGGNFPQLYGGYITPGSRLDEHNGMEFLVSQWNTNGGNDPYHVVLFEDTLKAKGPLVDTPPEPTPEPPPKPEPEPGDGQMTPQELYDLLLRELAASGAIDILTPDGRKLTLREAVGEIYDQTCSLHDLKGQMDPRTAVPQLDHVLSARFEGLFTQAVVIAVADKFGIDVNTLYAQVKESLG